MRSTLAVFAAMAAVCLAVGDDDPPAEPAPAVALAPGAVIDLTDNNFNNTMDTTQYLFVDFMTRSCGMCKQTDPEFEEASRIAFQQWNHVEGSGFVEGEDASVLSNVQFARVNANEERELVKRFGVNSAPYFMLISTGFMAHVPKQVSVPVMPTSAGIVSQLRKELNLKPTTSVKTLTDSWTMEKLMPWVFWRGSNMGKLTTTILLFEPSMDKAPLGSEEREAFESASKLLDDVSIELAKDMVTRQIRFVRIPPRDDLRSVFKLEDDGSTVALLYREYPDTKISVPLEASGSHEESVRDLAVWVRKQDTPQVAIVTHDDVHMYQQRENTDLVFVFVQEDAITDLRAAAKVQDELLDQVREMEAEGLANRGDVAVLLANGQKYDGWMKQFGLQPQVLPAVGLHMRSSPPLGAEESPAASAGSKTKTVKRGSADRFFGRVGEKTRFWDKSETEARRIQQERIDSAKDGEEGIPQTKASDRPVPETAHVTLPIAEIKALLRKRPESVQALPAADGSRDEL